MDAPDRRTALCTLGAGLAAGLAGCLGGTGDPDGPATETLSLGRVGSVLAHGDDRPAGAVYVLDDEDRTRAALAMVDADAPDVGRFLQDTDHATDALVLVVGLGPDTCHDAVAVDDVGVADGDLTATATVEHNGEEACGDAVVAAGTLLRARFEADPPTAAAVDLTDGFGDSGTVRAAAADPLGPRPGDLDGVVRPDGDPPVVPPALDCERDDVERAESWVTDPPWGDVAGEDGAPRWALRADRATAALGETVRVRLTNVSDELLGTGNRHKYALERYTEAGWQEVRVHPAGGPLGYTDEAVLHAPGDGFEWTLSLDEDLFADHVHADRIEVCPALGPGRYRFTFFEPGVAVAFDVTER